MSTDTRSSRREAPELPADFADELTALGDHHSDAPAYFAAMLRRLIEVSGASAGAVWRATNAGELDAIAADDLPREIVGEVAESTQQHAQVIIGVLTRGQPTLLPPHSGSGEAGNPTELLLAAAPVPNQPFAIELFADSELAAKPSQLALVLVQAGAIATHWLEQSERRRSEIEGRQQQQLDQFARDVHATLDRSLAAHVIANGVRDLLQCDRVTVALRRGSICRVQAISGQATVEPRADVAKSLTRIGNRVAAMGDPVWFDDETDDLPPQIESVLTAHVETTMVKSIAVLPMVRPTHTRHEFDQEPETDQDIPGELVGVLIIEQMQGVLPRHAIEPLLEPMLLHSAVALGNARDHSDLFLMPMWRLLGKGLNLFKGGWLPITLSVLAGLLLAAIVLVVVPSDFTLEAPGTLEPRQKRDIFASVEGMVETLHVKTGDVVSVEDPLVDLRNNDLELQYQQLLGQIARNQEELRSARRKVLQARNVEPSEQLQLVGEESRLESEEIDLAAQLTLLNAKREKLQVKSTVDGEVVTWNLEERLSNRRPVQVGQQLLTIAKPDAGWELMLFMPERRMGHLMNVWRELEEGETLPVTFILATDPGVFREGELVDMEPVAEVDEKQGHSVRMRVHVELENNGQPIIDPRPGAAVIAHVIVGRRPIGYVWLYEGYEWLQRNVFF